MARLGLGSFEKNFSPPAWKRCGAKESREDESPETGRVHQERTSPSGLKDPAARRVNSVCGRTLASGAIAALPRSQWSWELHKQSQIVGGG